MSAKTTYTVRFEPVGVEMEVEEGEWVLDAAFRQGIAVAHGCREGRCSSCKCVLLEGDAEVEDYSTFALPDYERDSGHVLLCRTQAFSDLTVELLNYDEDLIRRSIAVKEFAGKLASVTALTHDTRLLEVQLEQPMKFWAGQYVELTVVEAGVTRSYSMASTQSTPDTLRFIIRKYPDGAFSSLVDTTLQPGTALTVKGPYGSCFRREERPGPMVLVGGGSGMSPLWSILQDHLHSGEQRPIRFFYGARTRKDLFFLQEFAAIAQQLADFEFIPVLSQATAEDAWEGETGFVHEALERVLRAQQLPGEIDAYTCGPPPMIDAVLPVLQRLGVELDRTYVDKFTPASTKLELVH
ncbi:2Fe-2S iron-sulfur cluster binding domain-containing protein [Pseudorhodoferax sp. LjRoot39]|uniref:NADH:ubiquinone reductase (Na(+)-transporting) subunit F n=1 Tax=Pseudorhodoferax sp. LjRoot39 TaxID=3342328 RepID=UPI003ED04E35